MVGKGVRGVVGALGKGDGREKVGSKVGGRGCCGV